MRDITTEKIIELTSDLSEVALILYELEEFRNYGNGNIDTGFELRQDIWERLESAKELATDLAIEAEIVDGELKDMIEQFPSKDLSVELIIKTIIFINIGFKYKEVGIFSLGLAFTLYRLNNQECRA